MRQILVLNIRKLNNSNMNAYRSMLINLNLNLSKFHNLKL